MKISQEDAVRIAREFLAKEPKPLYPIDFSKPDVRLNEEEHKWRVTFDLIVPDDVVLSPDQVAVMVDTSNGTPEPIMML